MGVAKRNSMRMGAIALGLAFLRCGGDEDPGTGAAGHAGVGGAGGEIPAGGADTATGGDRTVAGTTGEGGSSGGEDARGGASQAGETSAGGRTSAGGETSAGGRTSQAGETSAGGRTSAGGETSAGGGEAGAAGASPDSDEIVSIAAAHSYTCAILGDRSLHCWGGGFYGTLGYGNVDTLGDDEPASAAGPVSVTTTPGLTTRQIAIGGGHVCALLSNGAVMCWGFANWGQTGHGNASTVGDNELPSSVNPLKLSATPGVVATQLAAGAYYTCALLSDDSLTCWGNNVDGQLGYGNQVPIGVTEYPMAAGPVSVTDSSGVKVLQVATGVAHTCVLLSDHSVKCWGRNADGQLGYGDQVVRGDDELPSSYGAVSVTTKPGVVVKSLALGSYHTCAVLSDGTAKCWGRGADGQLGYGNQTSIGDTELPSSVGDISVSATAGAKVEQLVAGYAHTCALLSNGSIQCWGGASNGQLGGGNTQVIGDNELPSSVGPVDVTKSAGVLGVALASGSDHLCALLSDNSLTCWGFGFGGQIGYGVAGIIGDTELPSSVAPVPF